jgi:hypothetical protein
MVHNRIIALSGSPVAPLEVVLTSQTGILWEEGRVVISPRAMTIPISYMPGVMEASSHAGIIKPGKRG